MVTLVHVDLVVRDLEASLRFYRDRLGCTLVEEGEVTGAVPAFYSGGRSSSMHLVLLKASPAMFGVMVELMAFAPGAAGEPLDVRYGSVGSVPSIYNLTFLVDDLDAFVARLEAEGVAPASPPMEVALPKSGATRIQFIRDPDGNLLELVDKRRAARDKP
ncbi:MAG TPA: VOC family protein [Minicystis sp.]|nr:VOC family protein [Minicystis sp.]